MLSEPSRARVDRIDQDLAPENEGEAPDLPALNMAVIARLAKLGADLPGFMDQLLGEFMSSVQRHTSGMRRAILHGDRETLLFSAHSLRGSCSLIGARRMAALCSQMEEKAHASGDQTLPMVVRLEMEYATVRTALDAAFSAAASSPRR